MKTPFIFSICMVIVIILMGVFGRVTEVVYCGEVLAVPDNCHANSQSDLTCSTYSVQWLYTNEKMLQAHAMQLIKKFEQKSNILAKQYIDCSSFDERMQGSVFKYKGERHTEYRVILYGTVKEQPVILNFSVRETPTNQSLPEFLQHVIYLLE